MCDFKRGCFFFKFETVDSHALYSYKNCVLSSVLNPHNAVVCAIFSTGQNRSNRPEVLYEKRCPKKVRKIQRKTSLTESFF